MIDESSYKTGYTLGYARKRDEDIKVIRKMRADFGKDYVSVKGDKDCELIVEAKVVALGQVLDALGYEEGDL